MKAELSEVPIPWTRVPWLLCCASKGSWPRAQKFESCFWCVLLDEGGFRADRAYLKLKVVVLLGLGFGFRLAETFSS